MSIHADDLRNSCGLIGELAADEIEALEKSEALLRSQNAELLEALKQTREQLHKLVIEGGGCDHSVGICWCVEQRALDLADAALAKVRP